MAKSALSATDARVVRTRKNLRDAALKLAADGHVGDITVAELARAAQINRATFYKHAQSPLQVLQEALIEDLNSLRASFLIDSLSKSTDLAALWIHTTEATADHLQRFEMIYKIGLAPDSDGTMLNLISQHITTSMEALFIERPDLLPKHAGQDDELVRNAYASFIGLGLAGIMQRWFNSEDRSIDVYKSLVINALPVWMTESGAACDYETPNKSLSTAKRGAKNKRK